MIFQIVDHCIESYSVKNLIYAVISLAHTTVRCELGKITLHKTYKQP